MKELASNKHSFVHLNKIHYTNCSLHNSPWIIQQLGSWDYLWVMWLSCVVLWMPLSPFLHLLFFWKKHYSLLSYTFGPLPAYNNPGKENLKLYYFSFFSPFLCGSGILVEVLVQSAFHQNRGRNATKKKRKITKHTL